MCATSLLPSPESSKQFGQPAGTEVVGQQPAGADAAGEVTCGWPLNDGRRCDYSARQNHVNRHRRELAAHSEHRAKLERESSRGQTQFGSFFGKRPRVSEDSASSTSSTRAIPPPPQPPPAATTSSTRFTPTRPSMPAPFHEFAFGGTATTAEGRAYTERMEQEQAILHQQQAQQEGIQLLASMAQAAAEAATAALSEQVHALTQQLQGLPAAVARDVPAAVREHDEAEALRRSTEAADSSLQNQIMAAATCVEIGKLEGFEFFPAENRIKCQDCFRYSSSKHCPGDLRRGACDAGWFQGVDETLVARADRPNKTRQRRPMSTVRWEVKHHCRAGSLHEWCVMYAAEQRKITSRSLAAGMTCASLVYQNLWEHDSYRSYERRIASQYAMGTYIGTKNHSREFARGLTDSIYTVTVECLQSALTTPDLATASPLAPKGRPPPIAQVADKATVARRTGQMHGTITFLEGRIIALFLSVLIVSDSTGDGLAKLQVTTYTEGKPLSLEASALRVQSTGQAYDGQYQGAEQGNTTGLDVPRHFCRRLRLNPKWSMSKWDPAHKIELGMKNVREGKSSPPSVAFYSGLATIVADSQSAYLYGKGHERILQGFAKLKQRMFSVGTVCTTRFCASERKVFKSYAGNLIFIISDMETTRVGEAGIQQQVLKIKTVTFVVHLFGVIDLLRPLKNLSLDLQAVNVLPWEIDARITVFLSDIELLERDLRARVLNRLLDSVDSRGKQHVAFEYLSLHEVRLKQRILELNDKQTGAGLMKVQLADSSSLRASRGRGNFASVLEEFNAALDDLADLAHDIHEKINERLMNTDAEERWVRRMEVALDLRVMAFPTSTVGKAALTSAVLAQARLVSAASLSLAAGDRIEVLVQEDPPIWWPAVLGGSVAGAGIHGVRLVYEAFPAQGYNAETASRVAFENQWWPCLPTPRSPARLWDAEENAWWPWRCMSPLTPADGQMDVDTGTTVTTAAAAALATTNADAELVAIAPTDPLPRASFDALLLLLEWMNSRFDEIDSEAPCPDPMPSIGELWRQRCLLEVRLQTAATSPYLPYSKLWEGASGTVIMHSVGTEPRFYEGCGDFWHLFKHMASKTSNEAVVEGMGSEWDLCTSPTRHLAFETGIKEAVICYNGPPPYRQEAKPFLRRALNTYFEGGPEKWNFEHEDKRFRGIVWAGGSKVIDRLLKVKPRLPSTTYGNSS